MNNLLTQSNCPMIHCNINNTENIIGRLKDYAVRPAPIEYLQYRYNNYTGDEVVLTLENWVIEKVIFNDPATIVFWKDGTKTVVKCQDGDTYNKELGLAMCCSKKLFGNKGNFNKVFKKYIGEDYE